MKNVELVRKKTVGELGLALARLRIWLTTVDGNEEEAGRLRDKARDELLAAMTDTVLVHCGHPPAQTPVPSNSQTRRMISKLRG